MKSIKSFFLISACLVLSNSAFAGPYEDGLKGDDERNYAVSFPAFQKAADADYYPAQFIMGGAYRHGNGRDKAEAKAAYWYGRAAAQGHVEAREAVQFYNAKMSESKVNTVSPLINMDKINKIREERKRCMRPIGTTDALRQKRLQTGQIYEWVKPYGCP